MFTTPFPDQVHYCALHESSLPNFPLRPEEENALSENAVEKRIKEFTLGRACARSALESLGMSPAPAIARGLNREPLWPHGIIGSISHAGEYAVASVAFQKDVLALGIDIERVSGRQILEVINVVADSAELEWINERQDLANIRATVVFSAKETVYKALYPLCNTFLEYDAISFAEGDDPNSLLGRASSKLQASLSDKASTKGLTTVDVSWQVVELVNGECFVQTSLYLLAK